MTNEKALVNVLGRTDASSLVTGSMVDSMALGSLQIAPENQNPELGIMVKKSNKINTVLQKQLKI